MLLIRGGDLMEQFIKELQIINEFYPDTFKFLLVSSYLLGFFCPLADGIALKLGFSVHDLFEKCSKKEGDPDE